MKISLSVLALLTSLFQVTAAFAAPELTVVDANFNFGTIPQGKKVQHNFVIRNSGDAPLQIKDVTVSCGCTAAKPSSTLLAPGKSAEIQVVFDSSNFYGKVQKTVSVVSNAGKAPNYTLYLDGTIVEVLQVTPRQLNLGSVKPGVTKQSSLTFINQGSSNVKLISVTTTSATLQIKATIKKGELKPGETGTIELSVTPRPDAKVMSGYLHIVTDYPQKKEITIPVYASLAR
jgi:copper(I)-binding protein